VTGADKPLAERGAGGLIWIGVLVLLALSPIPFGSNRPWAWSLMSLCASLLLAAWTVVVATGRRTIVWRKALAIPAVMMALVILWIIVTLIPGVGPVNPVWQLASEQMGQPLRQQTALSVDAALVALMRLLAYISVFWLSLQFCRNRDRAEALLAWVSWSGLAIAVYGLVNYFAGNHYLLWFERWASLGDVTGTFVNRNHYATFAGFGLICAAGIGVMAYRSAWRLSDRSQAALARSIECMVGRPLVYFIVMIVIGMAWLQTHSRMGLAAVALGIVVMLLLMMAVGLIRRRLAPIFILLLTGFFLFQVSGGATVERIEARASEERVPLFDVVTEQIMSAPYTGSGYGSFAQAFVTYRDARLSTASFFSAAHNTYLELAAELGLPAAILMIFAVAWCAILCLIGSFRRRADRLYPIIAVAVTVVVAAHALLDFSIQIPAVALLYAALLGMGVAQSWSTE
jgi:O-antigen ligase